jgi:DNA polymerase III subunit epsilon
LLDAELLAEVYAELIGGRQAALSFDAGKAPILPDGALQTERPHPLPPRVSNGALSRHRSFAAGLGERPIWVLYFNLVDQNAPRDHSQE